LKEEQFIGQLKDGNLDAYRELIEQFSGKIYNTALGLLQNKEDHLMVTSSSPFYHPGVKLENKERAAILFQSIEKLPINQRTAFTLHKLENLSYAELAEIMGVSMSSVESLMFRAKQNLRKFLGNYYDQNEK